MRTLAVFAVGALFGAFAYAANEEVRLALRLWADLTEERRMAAQP